MLKCKIKSIRSIGKQMTYNVTMKSNQHNYAIYDIEQNKFIITSNSHSCAYAFIAFQTAWLKYYYPLEFMCNLLTSEINNNDKNEKLNMYIAAAERMRIGCSDPHINKSGLEFKIGTIRTRHGEEIGLIKPLTFMKGVGDKAVVNIVQNQPYKNLEDFVKKTDARIVNVRVFASLVEAECMKCWGVSKELLLEQYSKAKDKLEKEKKEKKKYKKTMDKLGGKNVFDEFQSASKINV